MTIGLIDGPVVMDHPELANQHVREIPGNGNATYTQANSTACLHGTFSWDSFREAGISRSGDLSQLHSAGATHLNP